MKNLKLIVAVAKNWAIGKNNDLLWHLPEDMKFFKETTLNSVIITGRKNYLSIPERFRPLPKRFNIVLTRDKNFKSESDSMRVAHSWEDVEAILHEVKAQNKKEIFVIGGGEIYKQALSLDFVSEMYVTHVDKEYDADVYFPEINKQDWKKIKEDYYPENEDRKLSFSICKYIKNV